ncbi:MAG TPA: efflux RND transporter periplasmic adaptor subunit [Candidatus Baltobacteraceae bacterium]|nr:efflux RND transporter periplasmic adaptor subunit [Candidatus Baltobacteraceae bacterium]
MNPRSALNSITCACRHRGFWLLPVVAMAAAGCGSTAKVAAENPANAPHVAVVRVVKKPISSNLEIASEFEPYQEINVYAKVSGYIKDLRINWGTHVAQGQLLAVLEIPELQQELELDQASVRRSEQDVARAQEELARAQSSYTVAHLTYTRLANVQKTRPELVAQEEIDVAQGKDLEANAGVSSAKDALAGSQQELLGAKAALDRDKALYSYSNITAPFDGVVTEMDAYTGSLLPAGTSSNKGDQALCRLSQNDLLRLVIPVPERAVPDIHIGDTVAVDVSGLNRKFDGKIVRFSDQIDPDTRTMHTEVDVPNPKYVLVPGMYATVEIPLQTVQNALTVPVQAVQSSAEGHGTVLVVGPDNRIERRDVTTGIESATDIEILSGLSENERVVFGEQAQFRPGELVAPTVVAPSNMD